MTSSMLSLQREFELTINETIKAYFCRVTYKNPLFDIFAGIEYGDTVYVLESLKGPMNQGWKFGSFTGDKHSLYNYQIIIDRKLETCLIDCFIKRLAETNTDIKHSIQNGTFKYEAKDLGSQ